jgi:hypothetical protein
MPNALQELLAQVEDETTFIRFLTALRMDCESSRHDCERTYDDCLENDHWQTKSTANFLRSMSEWAHGDFADGVHDGEPLLRRFATMLYVGRYLLREDAPRPQRRG